MAYYGKKNRDPRKSPEILQNFKTRPKKTNLKLKENESESKENEPPRKNPIRQVRVTSTEGGASTSRYVDSDSEDGLPNFHFLQKDIMKQLKDHRKNQSFDELVEEVLQEQKELVEWNRKNAELNAKMDVLEAMVKAYKNLPQPKIRTPPDPSKNCKHLTLDQIKESFEKHKDLLGKIFNGDVYHRRHVAFHIPHNLGENMIAPVGLGLFEYNQLEFMVDRMVQAFDPEENPNMWKYFFQVLAPELCILIFMDTYNMTREETMDYLVPQVYD